jgi:hypothetical protein
VNDVLRENEKLEMPFVRPDMSGENERLEILRVRLSTSLGGDMGLEKMEEEEACCDRVGVDPVDPN